MNTFVDSIRTRPNDAVGWFARILTIAWASFWIWFILVSGFSELHSGVWGTLGYHLIATTIIVAAGLVVWWNELAGGILLIGLAAWSFWFFMNPRWLGPQWSVPLLLSAPPLVAGTLMTLLCLLRKRASRRSACDNKSEQVRD